MSVVDRKLSQTPTDDAKFVFTYRPLRFKDEVLGAP